MKEKNLKNKQGGITLTALVITIIVLLILVGTSITMLVGENGVLQKVIEAKIDSQKQSIIEQARLDITALQADKLSKNQVQDLTEEELEQILVPKYGTLYGEDTLLEKILLTEDNLNIPVSEIYEGVIQEKPHTHKFTNYKCEVCNIIEYPKKGQILVIGNRNYLVLKTDEENQTIELISTYNVQNSKMAYSELPEITIFDNNKTGIKYADSTLDTYLNNTFYNSSALSSMKPYIVETPIYQGLWKAGSVWGGMDDGSYGIPPNATFKYNTISLYYCRYEGKTFVGNRYVYAPDLMDVANYYNIIESSAQEIENPFYVLGSGYGYPDGVLTRSASSTNDKCAIESETSYSLGSYNGDSVRGAVRAMFNVDWKNIPKNNISHVHQGGTATCINLKKCQWCGQEYGSLASHVGGTATCQNKAICTVCNQEYGSLASHVGGTATCQNKAICTVCNQEYGDLGNHTVEDNICTLCGKILTVIASEHNYANNINYMVLGTWEYPDAKSVDINIEYQTESISYDWFSITEGTDYISGESYSSERNYLTTDGTIVKTTGNNNNIKFAGSTKTIKRFSNIEMLKGAIILRTDGSQTYWGGRIEICPNY